MQPSDEATLNDLGSRDPARIQAAVRDLKERMESGRSMEMAPLGPELFEPFGEDVPEETLLDFLAIVGRYRAFVPALSVEQKIAAAVVLALRYGTDTQLTYDAALKLKTSRDPVRAVEIAMAEVSRHGLASRRNVAGAQWLVSCLLDGKAPVRKATLEGLRRWPREKPYEEVREYITPQLEPDEVELLG